MKFIDYFTILSLLLFAFGCQSENASEEPLAVPDELAALESAYVEIPLQNDDVNVYRIELPSGASIAPHDGGERVVYSLGAYTLLFETEESEQTVSFNEGDVHYHEKGVHSVTNTGGTAAQFVVFERRASALRSPEALGDTPVPAPGTGAISEVLFKNDFAEVHRITLQPGSEIPAHQGYARAIYSLSDYTVAFTGPEGSSENRLEAGMTHFHETGLHSIENTGETVAEYLAVEFKQ